MALNLINIDTVFDKKLHESNFLLDIWEAIQIVIDITEKWVACCVIPVPSGCLEIWIRPSFQ